MLKLSLQTCVHKKRCALYAQFARVETTEIGGTMNIWIMRHGEAGFNAPTDSQRTLTEYGQQMALQQGQWLAQTLVNQGLRLDKILVSPYVRTQQTLQALLQGIQPGQFIKSFANSVENLVETWEGITPDGDPQSVVGYLDFLREEGAQAVLLISHLPLVYDLVLQLTAHQASVPFQPATVATLKWQGKTAQLVEYRIPQ